MPTPILYLQYTHMTQEMMRQGDREEIIEATIEMVNAELAKYQLKVCNNYAFVEDDDYIAEFSLYREGATKEDAEQIDHLNMKALDGKTFLPELELKRLLLAKVGQHMVALKTDGIAISNLGTKFDFRQLDGYTGDFNDEGYLMIGEKKVGRRAGTDQFAWVRTTDFSSQTILRFVNEGDRIRIFDDSDLASKEDEKCYFISTKILCQVEGAECFTLCYDSLTQEQKKKYTKVLTAIPVP